MMRASRNYGEHTKKGRERGAKGRNVKGWVINLGVRDIHIIIFPLVIGTSFFPFQCQLIGLIMWGERFVGVWWRWMMISLLRMFFNASSMELVQMQESEWGYHGANHGMWRRGNEMMSMESFPSFVARRIVFKNFKINFTKKKITKNILKSKW